MTNTDHEEHVILVNENDQEIGTQEKLEAHKQGNLHRAFSIMLYKQNGQELEFLLQQRHPHKYHSGNVWSNSACSHPRPHENLLDAAQRRLLEELNITHENLHIIDHFIYRAELENNLIEHEYDYVIVGQYDQPLEKPNPIEVINCRWKSAQEILSERHSPTPIYSAWFFDVFDRCLAYLSSK